MLTVRTEPRPVVICRKRQNNRAFPWPDFDQAN